MRDLKNMNASFKGNESGFTLIEIAIVLVIIGLLLGGVLQGQQLIENSRVKSATNTMNGIAAAAFSYQDRYGRMPGDDGPTATLNARGGNWAGANIVGGNTNGILNSTSANTFTGVYTANTEEGPLFFQHLRAAGFITGDPDLATGTAIILPTNSFGGLVGVTGATLWTTLTGIKICMSNVPGSAGIALDQQLDDGASDSGRFRAEADATGATNPTSATAATAYVETTNYTVCYRI